jgi:hypothetical protein
MSTQKGLSKPGLQAGLPLSVGLVLPVALTGRLPHCAAAESGGIRTRRMLVASVTVPWILRLLAVRAPELVR